MNRGCRLYVKNLDFKATRREILDFFQSHGWVVEDVFVPRRPGKDRNEGYCFVEFMNPEETSTALRVLQGTPGPGGRELMMSHAAPRAPKPNK